MHKQVVTSSQSLEAMEPYRRMVMKLAWRAWRRLPQQTKAWIDIEDVIADGMWWASRFAIKHYRPDWKGKFITQLYHSVHNYLIGEYIGKYSAQYQGWHRVNGVLKPIPHKSIEAMVLGLNKSNPAVDDVVGKIPSLIVSEDSIVQNMRTECFVVPALLEVYKVATPRLKDEMVSWFWHKRMRMANKGKFQRLTKEFRVLAAEEGITCDDCIHLIRSPKCLDSLSRNLFNIPFDLDNPTPGIGNNIW